MTFDADDIATFSDPDMPGYAIAAHSSGDIAGRYRHSYAEAFSVSGNKPTFVGAIADLAAVAIGDSLTIDGTAYSAAEIHSPDPAHPHMTRLVLERA